MRCPGCGERVPRGMAVCPHCDSRLEPRQASPRGRGHLATGGVPALRQVSPLPLTVALALLFLLVGMGGVRAAGLLRHAMRQQTAADLAALACSAFQSQDYTELEQAIDPTPFAPNATGPFDANSLVTALRGVDHAQGRVTACAYQQVSYVATSAHGAVANFTLTLRRAHSGTAEGILLIVTQQRDGSWMISRASTLMGAQ